MFETTVRAGVCRLANPGTRWLATGWNGGYATADDAVNVSVPNDFDRTDLAAYVAARREDAGFPGDGPALLTGVDLEHARGARAGPVAAVATTGLSNPASLPLDGSSANPDAGSDGGREGVGGGPEPSSEPGTVNLLVGIDRALDDGTLATLLATVVEAKTATLLSLTGFTGTTTDAVAVGSDPEGESAAFAGSGTAVGAAARACVRAAVRASFEARYADRAVPDAVADAEDGAVTTRRATVFRP